MSVANAFVSRANFNTALLGWAPAFAGVTLERRVSDTVSARGYLSVILTMVGASINQNEVIPAQAGIHASAANAFVSSANFNAALLRWTPAFAGVTLERRVSDTVCSSVASYLRKQG